MPSRLPGSLIAAAVFWIGFSNPARADDPFGFDQAGTPDQYACEAGTLPPPNYMCANAPRNHHLFSYYKISFHPSVGICSVTAVTDKLPDDAQLTATLAELRQQIEQKYGTLVEHFNKSLSAENHAGFNGGNIEDILLFPDYDHSEIRLTFDFVNHLKCEQAARADSKGAF